MSNSATSRPVQCPATEASIVLEKLRKIYGNPTRSQTSKPIDELIETILSQNTTDTNTERAFAGLRCSFDSWDDVASAPESHVVDAIRVGGLARQKAPRIQAVLQRIRKDRGSYDLDFLAVMSVDDATAWLTDLPGVGAKTAACVLLFSFGKAVVPVDTHVHRVSQRLSLVPQGTSAEQTQRLLEQQIRPGERYAAHMMFIRHGRETCKARNPKCAACILNDVCPSAFAFGG